MVLLLCNLHIYIYDVQLLIYYMFSRLFVMLVQSAATLPKHDFSVLYNHSE